VANKKNFHTKIEEPKSLERFFVEGRRAYAWFVFTGLIVYAQTLFFDFTHFDDDILVLRNFHFISDISNFFRAFTTDVFLRGTSEAYYRPLMTVSLMIDSLFGKPAPFVFHLSNILIHLGASCLAYIFFTRVGSSKRIAFLFSVLFTVHPVLTQAVAWIPGRNDPLLALSVLPSFLFFLSFIQTRKKWHLFWHLLFFALALFTKETAFALVLICPLYLRLILKERIVVIRNLVLAAGWAFLILTWFLLRNAAFLHPREYPVSYMAKSILSNSPAVFLYVSKIFFPFNLSVVPILADSTLLYGVMASILVISFLLFSKNKRNNHILF
jgi:hypothetical protein